MNYQSADRPAGALDVVSIAELALFSSPPDSGMRTTEEVVQAVRANWKFEIREVQEEAGNGVTFTFADGSVARFSAWK